MKKIHLKTIALCFVLTMTTTVASAELIRYNFIEQTHPQYLPAGELFSGYYIFDSETPNTNPYPLTFDSQGVFVNPITEIGISFSGQSGIFNNCLGETCSTIGALDVAESHYSVSANLYDDIGTRFLSFSMQSGDMFGWLPIQTDVLETRLSYEAGPGNAGILSFEFQGNNGTTYSDTSSLFSLTRVGVVPVPAAVWLFGSGLIALIGMARRKKA